MLKIVTGGIRTDKSECMLRHICDAVRAGKQILIMIPDQFSFEYDKRLYKILGAKLFNSIKVLSFNKLSEEVLEQYSTTSGEYADDNAKQIMMYLAIKRFKASKKAKYYKKQLDKAGFISSALDLVKDLRQASITPESLKTAGESITTGALSEKLSDINELYENYCNVLKENELKDSLTDIIEASQLISENKCFVGYSVFVDEFNGFSNDEMLMLETLIAQSAETVVSLTLSEENNFKTKLTPFANVISTQNRLVDIAKKYNLHIEFQKCADFSSYKSKAIEHINKNIFNPINNKADDIENIHVVSANDLYEEIEFVATEIRRLVCDDGYKYSQIAIVSRQLEDYFSVISGTFERYDIPYFMDTRQSVSQKALILYIMSVFEVVTTKSYNTETILRYIKSTLSCFSETQASQIEDYCFQWNVNGDMWLSDFTARDKSLNDKELKAINDIRERIISPLERFKKAGENATAGEISEALYAFLNEVYLTQIISSYIKKGMDSAVDNDSEIIEIAREFKQLWGVLSASVKSIYDNIGDESISLKDYYELLRLMLSQMTVSTPPQKLDAVTVASAERSMLADPKVIFVIGVNEGIIPHSTKQSGLFTDKDKDLLEKAGVVISKTTLWKIAEERFVAYNAFSSPSDILYVSYPATDLQGGVRRPSTLISQLKNMFGETIISSASQKGTAYYCTTARSTYYKYIENFRNSTEENVSIRKVLDEIPLYKDKLLYLEKIQENADFTLSDKMSRDLFFSNNLSVSATRLDTYNKCPFNFFCQYGLKIKPSQTVEMSPINRGNIVHYCLEKIMSKTDEKGNKTFNNEFLNMTDECLGIALDRLLVEYRDNELGGDFGKTNRFDFLFRRIHNLVFEVIKNIQREFNQSDFVPSDFEFSLIDSDGKSLLEIDLDNGIKINISGKIDRVDKYEKDGKKYIRIVDYKTGDKELLFEELYHGLNLQMILYLLALTDSENKKSAYSDCEPAGILYMPAKYLTPDIERAFGADADISVDISSAKAKNFKMNGLIVNIEESFKAMEKELNGVYIPVEIKKDGNFKATSKVIEPEIYRNLQKFAKDKVIEMANNLSNGKIQACPTGSVKFLPCDFCDYWSVCGNYHPENAVVFSKEDAQKLKEIIGMNTENEAGESNE